MDDDGLTSALAALLRQRRNKIGLSQKDCAQRAGVDRATIINIENGHVRSTRKFAQVCEALGTTQDAMLRQALKLVGEGPLFPVVGVVTKRLMTIRGMDADDLAEAMFVERELVDRLLEGDALPALWGAAAVALHVHVKVFEDAVTNGIPHAQRVLDRIRAAERRQG
ncbi:MAG TPA: helix-turn-helix domain-containing protein [Pseudonocardia sp.]|uniref:helix-turn-helix domain-containing protein n=1 Tax=Pseudonocardia sp. TaxID=60912 RepID=UPI002C66D133|nr:helix-turn-helix domain-containing protein [Pseudonocardia sp.]HTF53650.1 helix-turn-helix domain-containing protein [Pseudonocardia sp.]